MNCSSLALLIGIFSGFAVLLGIQIYRFGINNPENIDLLILFFITSLGCAITLTSTTPIKQPQGHSCKKLNRNQKELKGTGIQVY
ncbi:MAG: hypothetical protein SFU91_14820 [Chloroherpetonaceae bacterium]|nr:hypothetical protein [Chloroherpetonaceae bacterium]